MKVIPKCLIEDTDNAVGIESMSITYVQPGNTITDINDNVETLTVTAIPCDEMQDYVEGEPPVAIYTIKTDKWTTETPKDIEFIMNDFIARYKHVTNTEMYD